MIEKATSETGTKSRKFPFVLWIICATGLYVLSLLDISIRGPKLWLMFSCTAFAASIAVLKLRRLIHGTGWVFPQTETVLMGTVSIEALLYLWFSH